MSSPCAAAWLRQELPPSSRWGQLCSEELSSHQPPADLPATSSAAEVVAATFHGFTRSLQLLGAAAASWCQGMPPLRLQPGIMRAVGSMLTAAVDGRCPCLQRLQQLLVQVLQSIVDLLLAWQVHTRQQEAASRYMLQRLLCRWCAHGRPGLERLWQVLSCGPAGSGAADSVGPQLGAAAAQLLGHMLQLGGLVDSWPPGATVPARLVSSLSSQLRSDVRRAARAAAADITTGTSHSCSQRPAAAAAQAVASCCLSLARSEPSMQLALLNSVQLVEAARAMLGQPDLMPTGLTLLGVLAGSDPEAQLLLAEQPALVQALVGLLQQAAVEQDREQPAAAAPADTLAAQTAQLLTRVAQSGAEAQLALARVPAVSVALGRLLSSEEEQVANDAAETLAALQQGGGEAERLVREAVRSVMLALR